MAVGTNYGAFARVLSSGLTGKRTAEGFVGVRVQGIKELARQLQGFVGVLESDAVLFNAVESGAKIIGDDYKRRASIHMATGNLAKSVDSKKKRYENSTGGVVAVAIVGPKSTGTGGASERGGSGNHSWLLEFGTGPRRPGTQGRRTYVNVHQKINGRMGPMRKAGRMNDEAFAKAGQGHYFLMGSLRERADQAAGKSGYSRDFAGPGPRGDGRQQHPITLRPGEVIAPMPAHHWMRESIGIHRTNVYNQVIRVLKNAVSAYAA
jgi:hypothetical protein